MRKYTSTVSIPAYDGFSNGLIITLKISTIPDCNGVIHASGKVAEALQRNFKRIIEIMSSLKKSWEHLALKSYLLECNSPAYIVKDTKSSGMALSIALINLDRAIRSQTQVSGLSGTGVLRVDGSFDCSNLENIKYAAVKKNVQNLNKFITPHEGRNLFELEKVIYQLKRSSS